MALTEDADMRARDPLAIVERMADRNNWEFSRHPGDEITIAVSGARTNYHASFSWMEDISVLHFACAFAMNVPLVRLPEVQQLLNRVNEHLWIGHFEVWDQNGLVMFRHALLLTNDVFTSTGQCEALLGAALDTCERYYPAFQFVVWAGKSAREAMAAALLDTRGRA